MAQRATESMVVNASPDEVYRVVVDFERYPEWVSELKRIEVLERDVDGRALEVEFRAAAFGRSTTYALRYDYDLAPHVLRWWQTRGDLTAELHGQYQFDAVGAATKVTYDLEVELLVPIPSFVKARAANRIQTQALGELRARAEAHP
ncbi:MAG: SRPBCC family protein [Acidobacteriota bacterium]|nr:SRPBCC family protein [Acidobacteriota bacterium]MDE3044674.1 SRPBCC family protein [Acidobacteriota bacterium]